MHVGKSNKKAPCHIPTLQTAWEAAQLDQDNLGPLAPSVIVPSPPVLFTAVVVSSDMPKLTAPSEEHPPPSLIQSLVELVAFDIYVVVSLYGMRHHSSTHLTTALSFLSYNHSLSPSYPPFTLVLVPVTLSAISEQSCTTPPGAAAAWLGIPPSELLLAVVLAFTWLANLVYKYLSGG